MSESESLSDFSSDDYQIDPSFSLGEKKTRNGSCKSTAEDAFNIASTSQSESSHNALENEKNGCLNSILFSKYFEKIKKLDGNRYPRYRDGIEVRCRLCKVPLKGSEQITSNFIRHLRKKHKKQYDEYKKAKTEKSSKPSTANKFNQLVAELIVQDMLPISFVSSKGFKRVINFANPKLRVMSRPTAVAMIESSYASMVDYIKHVISCNLYFCTTADIWSTKHKSFLGYTMHWIDESLNRQSLAIACKRFPGSHTFDRIRDIIIEIHAEYKLSSMNVRATITDNASNFIKSFREFGIESVKINEFDFDDDEEEEEDEIHFGDIPNTVFNYRLPKHIRCATHTFNLVATTDFLNILKQDLALFQKHEKVMKKCSRLWKKVNRASSSEKLVAALGCQLKYPVATRWNSMHDSVKDLLKHKLKINDVMQMFHEELFTKPDFNHLQEYLDLLSPIAEAIDFLQGNQGMVYGFLLPTLARTRAKYVRIIDNEANKNYSDLATPVLEAIEERFFSYFTLSEDVNDAIVASVLCPQVKTTWIPVLNFNFGETKISEVIKLVKDTLAKEYNTDFPSESVTKDEANGFFDFEDGFTTKTLAETACDAEFCAYLADSSTSFFMLNKYPRLKSCFIKYNAPLPSSAAVERLFSYAGLLNSSRRGALCDSNFEKLLLLKANGFLNESE